MTLTESQVLEFLDIQLSTAIRVVEENRCNLGTLKISNQFKSVELELQTLTSIIDELDVNSSLCNEIKIRAQQLVTLYNEINQSQ